MVYVDIMETRKIFLNLEALAAELGLPQYYLRDLAKQRKIPALDVNGRLRFDPQDVGEALARLARQEGSGHE